MRQSYMTFLSFDATIQTNLGSLLALIVTAIMFTSPRAYLVCLVKRKRFRCRSVVILNPSHEEQELYLVIKFWFEAQTCLDCDIR